MLYFEGMKYISNIRSATKFLIDLVSSWYYCIAFCLGIQWSHSWTYWNSSSACKSDRHPSVPTAEKHQTTWSKLLRLSWRFSQQIWALHRVCGYFLFCFCFLVVYTVGASHNKFEHCIGSVVTFVGDNFTFLVQKVSGYIWWSPIFSFFQGYIDLSRNMLDFLSSFCLKLSSFGIKSFHLLLLKMKKLIPMFL